MMTTLQLVLASLVLFCFCTVCHGCGHKCSDPKAGPVLGGVDFVQLKSYFQEHGSLKKLSLPVQGVSSFNASFGGYQFWFQSSSNMEKFVAQPEEYYPQLGGYCSWGLTGYDIHVDDPSGFCLAGACLDSQNGVSFLTSEVQNFWYLKYEAKYDMEVNDPSSVDANIEAARKNFQTILIENNRDYCFNTDMLRTCK